MGGRFPMGGGGAAGGAGLPKPGEVLLISATTTAYATVKDALAASVDGDTVFIGSGEYTESNPLVVPSGVTLLSLAGRQGTRMVPTVAVGLNFFQLGSRTSIKGVAVEGVSAAAAFYFPSGVTDAEVEGVDVLDCDFGILCDSDAKSNTVTNLRYKSGTGTALCQSNLGCHMSLVACHLFQAATLTACIIADGAGAVVHSFLGHYDGDNTASGLLAKNGGTVRLQAGHMHTFDDAVHVGAGGGTVYAQACDILASTASDFRSDNGSGDTIVTGATQLNRAKLNLAPGTLVLGSSLNIFAGDEGTQDFGSKAIGTHLFPAELSTGGGNSHTEGMVVLTNTNLEAGTFVDRTADAASASGSDFDAFPGVEVDNCLYVGSVDFLHPNLKATTTIAAVLGAGAIEVTYWNGAIWLPISNMVAEANAPYSSKANTPLERVGAEQLRLNVASSVPKTINGFTCDWYRFRVSTEITASPRIQQIKLGPARGESNADGFPELMGHQTPIRTMIFGPPAFMEVSGAAPRDYDLPYSTNITLKGKKNRLQNGSLDGMGGIIPILSGDDTSRPMEVTLDLVPLAIGGDFEVVLTFSLQSHTQIIDSTAVDVSITRVVAALVANKKQEEVYSVDVSSLLPGDSVIFQLTRDASGTNEPPDTLAADVVLESAHVAVHRWHG